MKLSVVMTLSIVLSSFQGFAQQEEADSSNIRRLIESYLGGEKVHIGFVAQVSPRVRDDGSQTEWILDNQETRIFVSGKFGLNFSYYSEFENGFSRASQFYFTFSPTRYLWLDIGRFRQPNTKENLLELDKLTFVDSAPLIYNLGLGGDAPGLRARASFFEDRLSMSVGATAYGRVDKAAVRVVAVPANTLRDLEGVRCEIGCSYIYNESNSTYSEDHRLLSADLKIQYGATWIQGEGGWNSVPSGTARIAHAISAGVYLAKDMEVAGRFDYYSQVDRTWHLLYSTYFPRPHRSYTLGMNWIPEEGVKLQVNYVRDEHYSKHNLLLNLQYAFNRD